MNRTKSRPLQVRRYWQAVELCLTRFHDFKPEIASTSVRDYRENLLSTMDNPDLIYHEEPFYLACDISDHDLPLVKYRDEYAAVLQEAR